MNCRTAEGRRHTRSPGEAGFEDGTLNYLAIPAVGIGLRHLESIGIDSAKIKLLVNRYDSNLGLDRDAIETALNLEVFHVLPNDSDAIQKSPLEGNPVAANPSLVKNFAISADNLAGGRTAARKRSRAHSPWCCSTR